MSARERTELRLLRAELVDVHRDLVRARAQAEQLIASNDDLSSLLAAASRQASDLLKVSVAFRRLSDATDPAGAAWAIEDVAVNVLGTEDFVVLAGGPSDAMHPIAGAGSSFEEARQRPTTPAQLSQAGHHRVVPLRFAGNVVGAFVIRRLLEHRLPLDGPDEQVLALLAHFATTAIVAWRGRRDPSEAASRLAS